jgi:hypothetical protein
VCISDQGVLLVDANDHLDWRNGQAVPVAQAVIDEVKKLTSSNRWIPAMDLSSNDPDQLRREGANVGRAQQAAE